MTFALDAFELEHRIARGGMGEVWRARHRASGIPVAIKCLNGARAGADRLAQVLDAEIDVLSRLDHPHIALVLERGRTPATGPLPSLAPYLVMELAGGGSMSGVSIMPDWLALRRLLIAVLDALAHAHARGIIHRDLKPGNILLAGPEDLRPGPKLADFGLAQVLSAHTLAHTHSGVGGTPAYMAPEQFKGTVAGPPADLYALGCLAWRLATGAPPFRDSHPDALRALHCATHPGRLAAAISVPQGFAEWVGWLLEKAPGTRPASAAHAAHALRALGDVADAPSALPSRVADQETVTLTSLIWQVDGHTEPTHSVHTDADLPMPADWRRTNGQRLLDSIARGKLLHGIGLGLLHRRRPPFIGRVAARDRLWQTLRAVCADRVSRHVHLAGTTGSGRHALAGWLAERAHELGIAHVRRGAQPPAPGLTLWLADSPPACLPPKTLVVTCGRGDTPGDAQVIALDALTPVEQLRLVRILVGVTPEAGLEILEHTGGYPGAIIDTLGALVQSGAFEPSPVGHQLRRHPQRPWPALPESIAQTHLGATDPWHVIAQQYFDRATASRAQAALPHALLALNRALAAADAAELPPGHPDRLKIRAERGHIWLHMSRYAEARAELATTIELAEDTGQRAIAGYALRAVGEVAQHQDRLLDAVDAFEAALLRTTDAVQRAELQVALGRALRDLGRLAAAEAIYVQARSSFADAGRVDGLVSAMRGQANIAYSRGFAAPAEAILRDAITQADAAGVGATIRMALRCDLADYARVRGDLDAAETGVRDALDIMQSSGSGDTLILRMNLALISLARGQFGAARHRLAQCRREAESQDRRGLLAGILVTLLPCLAAAQDWDAWASTLGAANTLLAETGLFEADVAQPAEQAAALALDQGFAQRAAQAASIAATQWVGLGQQARAEALRIQYAVDMHDV